MIGETIVSKVMGAGLVGLSTVFFIAGIGGGAARPLAAMVPALAFGVSGLWMLLRRDSSEQALPPTLATEVQQLREAVQQVQLELDSTQTQVERLVEERAFLEKLLQERPPAKELGR
jgi:hypothetical protein